MPPAASALEVRGTAEHGEDGSSGQAALHVTRPVKRVEDGHEVPVKEWMSCLRSCGDTHDVAARARPVLLLRGHAGERAAGAEARLQQLVGHDVELLLFFALHIHHGSPGG